MSIAFAFFPLSGGGSDATKEVKQLAHHRHFEVD